MATGNPRTSAVVELLASELQGPGVVFCPNPKMPLWSNHPRVFIDVASTGSGKCPYCGHRVPPEGRRGRSFALSGRRASLA